MYLTLFRNIYYECSGQSQTPMLYFFAATSSFGSGKLETNTWHPARVHGSLEDVQRSMKGVGRWFRFSSHSSTAKFSVHLPQTLTRAGISKLHGQRLIGADTTKLWNTVITTTVILPCVISLEHFATPALMMQAYTCSRIPLGSEYRAYCLLVSLSPRMRLRRGMQGERRATGVEDDRWRGRSKQ